MRLRVPGRADFLRFPSEYGDPDRHHTCFMLCMVEPRIQQLPDGEELISFDGDDAPTRPLFDDPRQELLEHRHAAELAADLRNRCLVLARVVEEGAKRTAPS